MIDLPFLAGRAVAVMGLGKSGAATAEALMRSGAVVWAWDDNAERRKEAERAHIPLVDLRRQELEAAAMLVLSPGIPHSFPFPHPVAARARAAGLEIVCDLELLWRSRRDATYVGITGTNGKSTTTALIGHILDRAGKRAQTGGNLGTPALSLAPLEAGGIYVIEASSYQLELTPTLTFDIAVLTNISPDHLDRHGGLAGYIAAKQHIFDRQFGRQTAIVGIDDDHAREIHRELVARGDRIVIPISATRPVADGVSAADGQLIDASDDAAQKIADLTAIATLPGRHNWQNAAAAYAAVKAVGVAPAAIAEGLRSFPGLAHRQELIAVLDGVRYVNDSKATNADAAEKALICYDRVYWIAGGRPKEGGIESLRAHFPRVAHAYLIGEAAEAFARTLDGAVPYSISRTLEAAVAAAHTDARQAKPGAVVLLSPACASWDQFANFEARGERFRALVQALPEFRPLRQSAGGAS
ncbi:MAG TPA: UDP-N-acetylmuramoyl-L-alanine--D-glutamate ligase [Alphaproteobacteria bacterium]|nr:UDP-N-acetylmuramoyl-L-alanine--D-glutamate ligase [Alphaproteobacteria bacterium]